ncbi:flavoprotein [Arenimonas soli]|uniref:Flavoprotein n=1 Tax=Arenimonas soli TaxID=2269504 RepID=A0ABQ1HED5_9GAMM|nr:NAD(P)-binding domain-containing protein [Arenimonas soli]GGA70904.1 flavoprotein [Arenimonas soli]
MNTPLPVVIIGAGPVGLAAAAHLLSRGLEPLVLEAGDSVGAGMQRWGHVRMFSPWEFTIDSQARAVLAANGWKQPELAAFPTGGEVVDHYLRPLAATPEIAPRLRLGARVLGVARHRRDLMKDAGREAQPFVVQYQDASGEHEVRAQGVIDASGTIENPNPLGASGLPALGERALGERISYGIPDVLGSARGRYAGKRVLVVGSGHSAFNVLKDLARLSTLSPGMHVHWALRRNALARVLGGGDNDQLKERGRLGQDIARLVGEGMLTVHTGVEIDALENTASGIVAHAGERSLPAVDEIVAATGFRPDLSLLSEVRLKLHAGTQSPAALAPLIDPNQHSCGSVRPHGAQELRHPDDGIYIVGMKSYGRAPTFLLLTGYEQVRSVTAALAGDWEAARRVELVLPETGVCITQFADEATAAGLPAKAAGGCCGGAPVQDSSACCVADEDAKAEGKTGCGCGSPKPAAPVDKPPVQTTAGCCG